MIRYAPSARRRGERRVQRLSWRMLLVRRVSARERRAGWDRRQRAEGMRA